MLALFIRGKERKCNSTNFTCRRNPPSLLVRGNSLLLLPHRLLYRPANRGKTKKMQLHLSGESALP